MTNTQKQRRLAGKEEVAESQEEYQELRVGSSMLTGQDDFNSLESLTEVSKDNIYDYTEVLLRKMTLSCSML